MRMHPCVSRCARSAAGVAFWGCIVAASSAAFGFIGSVARAQPKPAAVARPPAGSVEEGRKLFEHRWSAGDPLSKGGDGVGPVYNDISCVACHRQAGIGGGGDAEHDVELATLLVRGKVPLSGQAPKEAVDLEPGYGRVPTVLLHNRGTSPGYDAWRLRMQNIKGLAENATAAERAKYWAAIARHDQRADRQASPVRTIPHRGFALRITRRNTPALWGLGLIDQIPARIILDEEQRQRQHKPATAGRAPTSNPEAADPYLELARQRFSAEVGRFGWRGQISTLREFVLAACSNELGLETPGHAQPADPLAKGYQAPGLDISREQCEDLLAFVYDLPRPEQRLPENPDTAAIVQYGQRVFHTIGCADCHRPKLGDVEGLYSDLLLHSMGHDLIDPVPANAALPPGTVVNPAGSYYGGAAVPLASRGVDPREEWRTPPLWGVRDSAPYMHDGRAPTLLAAIAAHGGQGARARHAFHELPGEDQTAVLLFLKSLAAPGSALPAREGNN